MAAVLMSPPIEENKAGRGKKVDDENLAQNAGFSARRSQRLARFARDLEHVSKELQSS